MIKHLRHLKTKTSQAVLLFNDPMLASIFLVFGMLALVFSLINFAEALSF